MNKLIKLFAETNIRTVRLRILLFISAKFRDEIKSHIAPWGELPDKTRMRLFNNIEKRGTIFTTT